MYNKRAIIFILILLVLPVGFIAIADESKPILQIALTSQFPPYTVDHNEKTGIDPELISRVLERAGYTVNFVPTPSKRQAKVTARNDIDGVTGWLNKFLDGCHAARPYRYWFNVLIVPDESSIKTIDDLSGKRLAIFEEAQKYIENFATYADKVSYIVESDSSIQAGRMIKAGRVDAYLGDYVGYYYALLKQYGMDEAERLTDIKYYFNPNPQKICFKDKQVRDRFDETLDQMIDEDIYSEIYNKYSPGIDPSYFPTKSR